MSQRLALDAVIDFYEHLTPISLDHLASIYAGDASFKDPFNDVRGIDAIRTIFLHMFEQTCNPRFTVEEQVLDGNRAFLIWTFRFGTRGRRTSEFLIRGASYLALCPDGKIVMHRDYWDVAEELYEKIPVLGTFMRFVKRFAKG